MSKKILIVDDDVVFSDGLKDQLSDEGYVVHLAKSGEEAIKQHAKEHPNIILLDLNMPDMNGTDVCRQIRNKDTFVPIIMLTAVDTEVDKVVNIELGVDDYLVKPFSFKELIARIKAVLRRATAAPKKKGWDEKFSFADVTLDLRKLTGMKGKDEFTVSAKELQLLRILSEHDGEPVSRETLIEQVWGSGYLSVSRALDQNIVRLRKKIEDDPENPKHIITVHGVGYQFNSKGK